jgi:Domain of unknown function (DUF4349)
VYRPLLIAIVILAACTRQASHDETVAMAAAPASMRAKAVVSENDSGPTGPEIPVQGQDAPMIIRTGEATIEVDSLDPAVARIRELARTTGGYVANTSAETGDNNVRTATLQLKVPVAHFDNALGGLAPIGRVETVNVTAQDVGEEYVDVDARVTNSRRLEQRLIDLLATRTGKLKDVLDVERELARVRGDIETAEGRLRYLRAHAATSTLAITVHEHPPILVDRPGDHPLRAALHQAWRNFITLTAAAIASLGVLLPLVLVAVALWVALRRKERSASDPVRGAP